jgi:hypothetical protein
MIILHRPEREAFSNSNISSSSSVQICCESLESILKLLHIYSRLYDYTSLPVTFIHTLASAASVLLMKSHIGVSSADDTPLPKSIDIISTAIDGLSQTWPSAKQVGGVIKSAMRDSAAPDDHPNTSRETIDFMPDILELDTSCNDNNNNSIEDFQSKDDTPAFIDPVANPNYYFIGKNL